MLDESNQLTGGQNRRAIIQRSGGMVLHPLAEVGIGMLVAVVIGCRQLMVHILRNGKRRQPEQDDEHRQRDELTKQRNR